MKMKIIKMKTDVNEIQNSNKNSKYNHVFRNTIDTVFQRLTNEKTSTDKNQYKN